MSESRRIIPDKGIKDEQGLYVRLPSASPASTAVTQPLPEPELTLDDILKQQLTALRRVTKQLVERSVLLNMTKDEIASLSTLIKTTMELKQREKDLLDGMSDEELEKAAHADSDSGG